jgi:hypothetical protein
LQDVYKKYNQKPYFNVKYSIKFCANISDEEFCGSQNYPAKITAHKISRCIFYDVFLGSNKTLLDPMAIDD